MYNAKNNRKNERIKGKNRRNGRKQMKGWVRKDNNDRIPAVNRLERKIAQKEDSTSENQKGERKTAKKRKLER